VAATPPVLHVNLSNAPASGARLTTTATGRLLEIDGVCGHRMTAGLGICGAQGATDESKDLRACFLGVTRDERLEELPIIRIAEVGACTTSKRARGKCAFCSVNAITEGQCVASNHTFFFTAIDSLAQESEAITVRMRIAQKLATASVATRVNVRTMAASVPTGAFSAALGHHLTDLVHFALGNIPECTSLRSDILKSSVVHVSVAKIGDVMNTVESVSNGGTERRLLEQGWLSAHLDVALGSVAKPSDSSAAADLQRYAARCLQAVIARGLSTDEAVASSTFVSGEEGLPGFWAGFLIEGLVVESVIVEESGCPEFDEDAEAIAWTRSTVSQMIGEQAFLRGQVCPSTSVCDIPIRVRFVSLRSRAANKPFGTHRV
jgi:hypothetical protein